ncbi:MAG: hypothetical protein LBE16_08450 [Clostridiales Family XIII bacterium]|jgi:hypothetical protein|nr:hypothetical protein [Clostridiales Family XIII bacterium]
MFEKKEAEKKEWRDGVYLCTATDSMEADILESKLRGEGVPSERRWKGAGNFLEIFMGANSICPIDIYVPADSLADARNIVIPFPLAEDADIEE